MQAPERWGHSVPIDAIQILPLKLKQDKEGGEGGGHKLQINQIRFKNVKRLFGMLHKFAHTSALRLYGYPMPN